MTRDYGSQRLLEATVEDPPATETVIRFLDREAEIETRYGGGFVQSIEGVSGGIREGRSLDWFFFVNGVESPVGAADAEVQGGDVVWWDYRDWTDAMRTPAVVGSWPEPFAQASADGDRAPVRIECDGARAACATVAKRLAEEGVEADRAGRGAAGADALRLEVGPWERLRGDRHAELLDEGPEASGVFARFVPTAGGYRLLGLDAGVEPAERLGAHAGLVAALRDRERPPTWLVTGTDRAGVERAAELLDAERLADRYAVAVDAEGARALPVIGVAG